MRQAEPRVSRDGRSGRTASGSTAGTPWTRCGRVGLVCRRRNPGLNAEFMDRRFAIGAVLKRGVRLRLNLRGQAIGLIACSDGRPEGDPAVQGLVQALAGWGMQPVLARTLYRRAPAPFSGSPQDRARQLMEFFRDDAIRAIFDISGGDSANQILPYLDYDVIRKQAKPFFGMSDVSVILNAITARSAVPAFHYQIANLVGAHSHAQRALFQELFLDDRDTWHRVTFRYSWLRGRGLAGCVVGGNIRCFLKLAGTPYLPDPRNKILFLESLGGGPGRMASLLSQLRQTGYFDQLGGVLLGSFTQMAVESQQPTIEELVLDAAHDYHFPIAMTQQVGHGDDAHCLPLGLALSLD